MTLNELRRQWELDGEYCQTEGCGMRKSPATDLCWEHRVQRPLVHSEEWRPLVHEKDLGVPMRVGPSVTHWCSLISDRRIVRL